MIALIENLSKGWFASRNQPINGISQAILKKLPLHRKAA
jgi:hypothetical protein